MRDQHQVHTTHAENGGDDAEANEVLRGRVNQVASENDERDRLGIGLVGQPEQLGDCGLFAIEGWIGGGRRGG